MTILGHGDLIAVTGLGIAVTVFVAIVRRLGFRSGPSAILFAMFVAAVSAVASTHSTRKFRPAWICQFGGPGCRCIGGTRAIWRVFAWKWRRHIRN